MNIVLKGNRFDDGVYLEKVIPCKNEIEFRMYYAELYTRMIFLTGDLPEGDDLFSEIEPGKRYVFKHKKGIFTIEEGA